MSRFIFLFLWPPYLTSLRHPPLLLLLLLLLLLTLHAISYLSSPLLHLLFLFLHFISLPHLHSLLFTQFIEKKKIVVNYSKSYSLPIFSFLFLLAVLALWRKEENSPLLRQPMTPTGRQTDTPDLLHCLAWLPCRHERPLERQPSGSLLCFASQI